LKVVFNGRTDDGRPEIPDDGHWAYAAGDVSSPVEAERIVATAVEHFGKVDVLVNNAGRYQDRSLLKMSDAEFDEVVRSHLYGTFYCGRAAARAMKVSGGGRIINISSDSSTGVFGQSSYAAAKAGIVGLTMTWSIELAKYGVQVNAVFPNAATAPVLAVEGMAERWGHRGPFPRSMGEPGEAATLVAFLACSEHAAAITGQILALGGDRLALWHGFHETKVAFKTGGWSYEDLDRTLRPLFERDLWKPGFTP